MTYVASPAVRAHAGRSGVDLQAVAQATGRTHLAREDVDRAAAGQIPDERPAARDEPGRQAPARHWDVDHAAFGPVRTEPLSRLARAAAASLGAANALIPQVTHHDRADMRAAEALRASARPGAEARGVKLTPLAIHVMALSRTLRAFPRFNASLCPEGATLILKDYVHVGIAVDTPRGLVVPVIRDADRKGLVALAAEIAELAETAREGRLRQHQTGGASMTVSSLGARGGTGFTPIVNPPELAILGLSRTETVPVWEDGEWRPVPTTPIDLSYDHRVINGADAARFVTAYRRAVETPESMVLRTPPGAA